VLGADEDGGGLGAPEVEGAGGVGTGSGGFDVGVGAGGLAAPARGATEEVAGGVPATAAPALGSEGTAVVVAGEVGVDGMGVVGVAAVGGAVVPAEALPGGAVAAGTEVVAGVEGALAPVSVPPPTSGQTK
jgi:hypothetical protein